MAAIYYTAKRSLVSGHTADTAYSFDIGMMGLTPSSKAQRTEHKSISGHVETWLDNIEKSRAFLTDLVDKNEALYGVMWEFLDSCLGGETFTIDEYGTVAVPDNPISVALVSKNITPTRHNSTRFFRFQFEIREIV